MSLSLREPYNCPLVRQQELYKSKDYYNVTKLFPFQLFLVRTYCDGEWSSRWK